MITQTNIFFFLTSQLFRCSFIAVSSSDPTKILSVKVDRKQWFNGRYGVQFHSRWVFSFHRCFPHKLFQKLRIVIENC